MSWQIVTDLDELSEGSSVRSKDGGELGTVESVDHEENIAWVRIPITSRPGATELLDIAPEDLEMASGESKWSNQR